MHRLLILLSKYGNPHRQVRALVILDGLIQNAGGRFQRAFADEPLLERLRLMARDEMVDAHVRQKCKVLFVQWANAYKGTPGLERIANLYKEFPKTQVQRPAAARQSVLADSTAADTDPESPFAEPQPRPRTNSRPQAPVQATASHSRPVTLTPTSSGFSSKLFKDKKGSTNKSFSLSKEKDNMTNCIAQSSIASTNLLNGLQLINREKERVSSNPEVMRRMEACKELRRKILYYINNVESEKWIGSLVNANDELVKALTAYEIMDRSVDDDSDSDAWESKAPATQRGVSSTAEQQLAGLSIDSPPAKPPRPAPASIPMPKAAPPPPQPAADESDEDPFGDSHVAKTPFEERAGMTWREV